MLYPVMRSCLLLLAFSVLAVLAGCDLLAPLPSSDSLAPGTYTLRVDGRSYSGTARYYPIKDFPSVPPAVFLAATCSSSPFVLETAAFLSSQAGDSFEPSRASFRSPRGALYAYRGGEVRIDAVEPDGLRGTFSIRMKDVGLATNGGSTTARGAFYAITSVTGQNC